MSEIALHELERCLGCKNAKCILGCPAKTQIKDMIQMVKNGEILEAGKMLFDNNPLSLICAYVCPHENQCEGSCILNVKNSPIKISEVEKYVSSFYLDSTIKEEYKIDQNKKVAIIGSGPAGITIAIILAQKGYAVTIFEGHDRIGGVLRYGIPEFRLPKEVLNKLKQKMLRMGIKIRPNTIIGQNINIDDLFNDGYLTTFIGTGVWRPNRLKIKGETLGHVHYAIDYLKNPDVYQLGKRIIIVGAGNVAIDAARTALRHGSYDIIVMYRGGFSDMTALKTEIQYAQYEGIRFLIHTLPLEITDHSIKFQKTIHNDLHEIKVIDEFGEIECDSVIIAIGQGPRSIIVNSTKGIETNQKGLVVTDDLGHTTKAGVFSSGDVVTGAKTVVEAVVQSKKVAQSMIEYMEKIRH